LTFQVQEIDYALYFERSFDLVPSTALFLAILGHGLCCGAGIWLGQSGRDILLHRTLEIPVGLADVVLAQQEGGAEGCAAGHTA
jgi:hypothetical protein